MPSNGLTLATIDALIPKRKELALVIHGAVVAELNRKSMSR